MKYTRKPEVVEAVQWKDGSLKGGATRWIVDAIYAEPGKSGSLMRTGMKVLIYNSKGISTVSDGDWIVKGENGELSCCAQKLFEETYKKVE